MPGIFLDTNLASSKNSVAVNDGTGIIYTFIIHTPESVHKCIEQILKPTRRLSFSELN